MQAELITGTQIRAARGALNMSVAELARLTGVGHATIVRYEQFSGFPNTRKDSLVKIIATLEAAGIEFIGSPSNAPGIRIHTKPKDTIQKS